MIPCNQTKGTRRIVDLEKLKKGGNNMSGILKFIIWNALGIFMFFIPVSIAGKSTIPLDHIVSGITANFPLFAQVYTLIVIILGALLPFYEKSWNKDKTNLVLSIIKLLGIAAGFMVFFKMGPQNLLREDMLPFLFNKVAVPVGLIVPIGSLFLTFITGYGLLEFIGVLVRPVMRPIWHLPGRAAVNAVASFVGSFSVGIFMTNRLLKEGKYTMKEAAIIVAGFSTVSATFMVIVAKTLGLMEIWNIFFWITLIITFLVSAITVRIRPLKTVEDVYISEKDPEPDTKGNLLAFAIKEGLKFARESKPIWVNMAANLKDGFNMNLRLVPTTMSIGFIALFLVKMTPVFDYLGYIYYPFTLLLGLPEPFTVAKACAVVGAEMFIPSVLVASMGIPAASKFVVGVVSISAILFFAGSIPCILATDIKLSIKDIIVILIQRTILTIIFAAPLARLLF
ncbi:MAG: hypothetical protein PWQ96_2081 [Clostridia bacterium]|nr:hypothetical protein [Clostridia bacterium]